jgi:hypothetical protein
MVKLRLALSPRSELPSVFPEGSQLATFSGGLLQANEYFSSLPDRARAGYCGNAPKWRSIARTGQGQGSSSDPRAVAVVASLDTLWDSAGGLG